MADYLPAPVIEYPPEKRAAFEALYQTVLGAQGQTVPYVLPYPKYEFFSYLADDKDVILHGSNDATIQEFVPMRAGMDANPHGNIMGVYGTADGIWPLFFALLDKKVYKGSMRNGVGWAIGDDEVDFTPEAAQKGARKEYQFSLNAEQLDKPIWNTGTLYVLPRATFEQQRYTNGTLSPEWASRAPVKPLARFTVEPEDFPFLHSVNGHDDSHIFRLYDLLDVFAKNFIQHTELPDGHAFEHSWSATLGAQVVELIDITRQHFAVCSVELSAAEQKGPVWVRLRGPETFKNVVTRVMTGEINQA